MTYKFKYSELYRTIGGSGLMPDCVLLRVSEINRMIYKLDSLGVSWDLIIPSFSRDDIYLMTYY